MEGQPVEKSLNSNMSNTFGVKLRQKKTNKELGDLTYRRKSSVSDTGNMI